MEILLAVVVTFAVIFFGALISLGNERQRKAIENLHEQFVLWATQDLLIKREKLSHDVQIENPIAWINKTVGKIFGESLDLRMTESLNNPQAIVFVASNQRIFLFSPTSPENLRRLKREHKNRLLQLGNSHPLLNMPRNAEYRKITILNGDILYDLQFSVVWKLLTGSELTQSNQIWIYSFPSDNHAGK